VKITPTTGKLFPLTPLPESYLNYTTDPGRVVWIT